MPKNQSGQTQLSPYHPKLYEETPTDFHLDCDVSEEGRVVKLVDVVSDVLLPNVSSHPHPRHVSHVRRILVDGTVTVTAHTYVITCRYIPLQGHLQTDVIILIADSLGISVCQRSLFCFRALR